MGVQIIFTTNKLVGRIRNPTSNAPQNDYEEDNFHFCFRKDVFFFNLKKFAARCFFETKCAAGRTNQTKCATGQIFDQIRKGSLSF